MRDWKKLTALLLAVLMLLGLAACALEEDDLNTAAVIIGELVEAAQNAASPPPTREPAAELVELPAEEPEPAPAENPEENPAEEPAEAPAEVPEEAPALDPDGWYTTKEDVALYLHLYGELPGNFITKSEARALGWSGGSLDRYADGKSIGGDRFVNYEGLLPDGDYRECDVNTMHASKRGSERIIWSSDGRIYYTGDHYGSFTLLYGEE